MIENIGRIVDILLFIIIGVVVKLLMVLVIGVGIVFMFGVNGFVIFLVMVVGVIGVGFILIIEVGLIIKIGELIGVLLIVILVVYIGKCLSGKIVLDMMFVLFVVILGFGLVGIWLFYNIIFVLNVVGVFIKDSLVGSLFIVFIVIVVVWGLLFIFLVLLVVLVIVFSLDGVVGGVVFVGCVV